MPYENSRTSPRLDPRDPFVLDTHELGRRAGSMRQLSRSVTAPAGLGLDMVGVPEGAAAELDLRLEAVMEGVLVTGEVRAPLSGECSRCLERFSDQVRADFCELFAYEDAELDEEEAGRLTGDLLDLEPVVRDAVVLTLPLSPVCRDDCPGLCPDCGERLADDPDHRHDERVDPRWAALQTMIDDQTTFDDKADADGAGGEQES